MNKFLLFIGFVFFVFIIFNFFRGLRYFRNVYKKQLSDVLTKDEYKVKGKFE